MILARNFLTALLAASLLPAASLPGPQLKEGTDVKLKFAEDISSKTAQVDDNVSLVVDEDVVVGDKVVIKAGSKAMARVSHVQRAGMMGKAGELVVKLDYVRAGDQKIKLRGSKSREGEDKFTSALVLTVLLGPVGLIKKGKNIDVRQGTAFNAFVDEDVSLLTAAH